MTSEALAEIMKAMDELNSRFDWIEEVLDSIETQLVQIGIYR